MSMLTEPFRRAPFSTVFLMSELFLLAAPLVMGTGPLDALWRILVVPAYLVITLVSLIVPWTAHVPIAATALLLLLALDLLPGRWRRPGPEDRHAP